MRQSKIRLPDYHPKQQLFADSPATQILLGGDTRGGKTAGFKLWLCRMCGTIPGLQCDIFRLHEDDVIAGYMQGDFSFPVLLSQWIKDGLVKHNQKEIRFWNGSLISLEHCFTADTPIQTTEGIKTIKELIGRHGYVNIAKSLTGYFENVRKIKTQAEIVEITFDDGSIYKCTPDHKFITTSGLVEAKDLTGKLCITNESNLSAKEFKCLTAKDTHLTENTSVQEQKDYIGLFGSFITALSQKVTKFTIRMKTEPTIKLKTSNYLKYQNIGVCTQIRQKLKQEVLLPSEALKLLQLREHGISHQKVTNGTNSKLLRSSSVGLKEYARGVIQSLKDLITIDFALRNVALLQPTRQTGISSQKYAQTAETHLQLSQKPELRLAVESVDTKFKHKQCVSVKPAGNKDVYCLTVPEYGYFPLSNGVLVSNCSTDNAMSKHQGIPKHIRAFDEAGQIPERRMKWLTGWMILNEDMKAKLPPEYREYFPKVIYLSNPIGPSKPYLRKRFVKARPKFQIEQQGAWKLQYIPFRVEDNPSEDAATTRLRVAEIADENTAKALLNEDWDAQVGNYFQDWDEDINVCKEFVIPDFWLRFRCFDYGSYEPWYCVWFAVSPGTMIHEGTPDERYLPRGCLVAYREWYGCRAEHPQNDQDYKITSLAPREWSNKMMAEGIVDRTEERFDNQPTYTDKFPFNNLGGRTIAKEFEDAGVTLTLGDTDRKNGWAQMNSRIVGKKLVAGSDERFPMLVVFESLKYARDYIPMLERHDNEGKQWDAQESGEPTHCADTFRLGSMVHQIIHDAPVTSKEQFDKKLNRQSNFKRTIRNLAPGLNIG